MESPPPARPHCHLAFSSLYNASRLWREAETALESGLTNRVLAIGYLDDGYSESEEPIPGFEIIRLPRINFPLPRLLRRSLQFLFWSFATERVVVARRASLIQAHSLAALVAGVMAKRKLGVPLIYDAHELETERTGWSLPQKVIARIFEKALISYCDHTFVVGDMIADWYRRKYRGIRLSVLRNAPRARALPLNYKNSMRRALNIPNGAMIFLYLGVIDNGRGYQMLIDAFRDLPHDKHLVFMGSGPAANKVIAAAQTVPNIHWHSPVHAMEVVSYAAGTDVGISLIEDTCLSYRYCLPNKLHEYRLAGLPVIVSNLPEMASLVSKTEAGWIVEPEMRAFRELVRRLTPEDIVRQRMLASSHAPLTWEGEQDHYSATVRHLLE